MIDTEDRPEAWEKSVHIRCPECDNVFPAMAYFNKGDPFPTYVATCPICEYMILDSEWEEVS